MRIAHVTDVHWMAPPPVTRLFGKRLLGTLNLYVMGRRHEFAEDVQGALVDHVVRLGPDLVLVTGDVTAQALPEEFEKARTALGPILTRFPTFAIPGNHDVYTVGAQREARFEKYFKDWMHKSSTAPIGRLDLGDVTVLGLDPNKPGLQADGVVPQGQLAKLAEVLDGPDLVGRFVVLAIHYPVVRADGRLYDVRGHGLTNAQALVDVLARAKTRPKLVVHGHKHHGWHGKITLPDGVVVDEYNPGSGGYVRDDVKHRSGAMNLYTVEEGQLAKVERWVWDGARFEKEAEPYASGF